MSDQQYSEDREIINEILAQFNNLKRGLSAGFLSEESFEKLINHFDDEDDLPQALEAAEMGVEYFPFSSMLMVKKADILIATRKYLQALDLLETASLYDSSDVNIYILKIDAYLALDRHEEAVELLEQALQTFTGDERIELLFELADVYDDYEEFDKVFDCLKIILEEEPTNEEALFKICFWTDFTGRNEESIRLHEKIINNHPYNEIAWFNLGAAYQGIKLYEKAVDAYKYAIAIDEKFDYAYRNMGDAYLRLHKYKDAIEVLEKVLELTRPEDVIFEALGHCYFRLKNVAQARFYYKKAVHLSPDDSKLYHKIATTYMQEEQWQSAVKQLENALRIHRNVPDYNLAMGACLMNLGRSKEAIQYFNNIVRSKPKNIAGWDALVKALFALEMYEEAATQALRAIEATNNNPNFLYFYSACLFALGKSKEGLIQLENAIAIAPKKLKKLLELSPSILQNPMVVDLIAKQKKSSRKK